MAQSSLKLNWRHRTSRKFYYANVNAIQTSCITVMQLNWLTPHLSDSWRSIFWLPVSMFDCNFVHLQPWHDYAEQDVSISFIQCFKNVLFCPSGRHITFWNVKECTVPNFNLQLQKCGIKATENALSKVGIWGPNCFNFNFNFNIHPTP